MTGLYLHIPFCTQRCVYCDFYFVTTRSTHASFVEALAAELACHARGRPGTSLGTLYLGGGTPSLLDLAEIERLLEAVANHFDTSALREVTLELNPEDAELDYLKGLRRLGIDRLSIGIQSFFAEDLAFMNRSHTAEQAAAVIPLARQAGFDNFSVDLIFGLPDQPEQRWQDNLQRVAEQEVPHLSTYGLTVEARTPLWKQIERGLVTPAEDETMRERYQYTMDYLRERGYEHYEISSFARPNRRAQHNQLYWQHVNYLGLGPSAHSFWWNDDEPARRWANVRSLRRYEEELAQNNLPVHEEEHLSRPELADEHVMLRLRTADGLDLDRLRTRYGFDLARQKEDTLDQLQREELIAPITNGRVRLTDAGKHVCDAVTTALISP